MAANMKPIASILPATGSAAPTSGGNQRALDAYAKYKAEKAAAAAAPQPATGPGQSPYPTFKTKEIANKRIGGLSAPGKMPEGSFGISAHDCKTGSVLRQITGSTCSDCYALKGHYVMPATRKAHARRLGLINEALADPEKRKEWVGAFIKLMENKKHFRWHDSGDIQSPEHLGLITEVARNTPETKHWLPTREEHMVNAYHKAGGTVPDNMIIRMSAAHQDTPPPKRFANTSTVHKMAPAPQGSYVCPAKDQEGECNGAKHGGTNCRHCWDHGEKSISYPWH